MRFDEFRNCKRVLSSKVLRVALGVALPLLRKVIEGEDRRNRAHGDAGAAINAFDGIVVEHLSALELCTTLFRMDAIDRAGVHAGVVLGADARFCNYIGHEYVSPEILLDC